MPLLDVNGTQLFVESFGDGSETVLLLHSLFFSGEMYAPQIDRLSQSRRCVTIDWRGQGRSASPLSGYDVDNLCNDVLAVMDALEMPHAHWVGMSVGGVVGIRVAAQFPSRVLSLAIGGASAEAEPAEKLAKYEELLLKGFAQDPESVVDNIMKIIYGAPFLTDPKFRRQAERERELILSNNGPELARACAPILRRVDCRHLLEHIECPTSVFVGELDHANPPEKSKVIADGVKGAVLTIFRSVGHQPNVEAPEQLTKYLADHLAAASG